jgi:hypothetical protein
MITHKRPLSRRYLEYIASPLWQEQRRLALEAHGSECPCGSIHRIQVHHLRYGDLTDITPRDLIPLCERCHELVHNSDRLRDLLIECDSVINKRKVIQRYLERVPFRNMRYREAKRTLSVYKEHRELIEESRKKRASQQAAERHGNSLRKLRNTACIKLNISMAEASALSHADLNVRIAAFNKAYSSELLRKKRQELNKYNQGQGSNYKYRPPLHLSATKCIALPY